MNKNNSLKEEIKLSDLMEDIVITFPKKGLNQLYRWVCNRYAQKLCEMYDWYFEDCFWVSDDVGGVFCTCDIEYSLGMNDIRLLVDENVDYNIFVEWWDYNMLITYAKDNHPNDSRYHEINLYTWLKGFPEDKKITKEELEKESELYWKRNLKVD